MKVLVVEDEAETAVLIKQGFDKGGFMTDVAGDGEAGLELALSRTYDLIVLNILLPKRDGWSVLQALRHTGCGVPVIFVTARNSLAEKVKGLEMGADDYLTKPFAFSELLARAHSVLRRGGAQPPQRLRVVDLELDLLAHRAMRDGKVIELTPKECALLAFFMRHPGEVLSRTLLAQHVWGMNDSNGAGAQAIDVTLHRLRKKIDDPFALKLLHTVHGVGYVLETGHG